MPRRRCVGCGLLGPKSELVRIALSRHDGGRPARAVIDADAVLPGRGAYLCRDPARGEPAAGCLELAARRGAIARALRSSTKLVESMSP